jgi:hypothetical protein
MSQARLIIGATLAATLFVVAAQEEMSELASTNESTLLADVVGTLASTPGPSKLPPVNRSCDRACILLFVIFFVVFCFVLRGIVVFVLELKRMRDFDRLPSGSLARRATNPSLADSTNHSGTTNTHSRPSGTSS